MRAICIYATKSDYTFRSILFLEKDQKPVEAIEAYASAKYEDDAEGKERWLIGLEFFYVHPIAKRIAGVPSLHGQDILAYQGSHLKLNICATFAVAPGFEMTMAEIDALSDTMHHATEHTVEYWPKDGR